MSDTEDAEVMKALLSWGRRRRSIEAERDPLVRRALGEGVSIEAVHQTTGLGRTTIERIREKGE